MSIRNKPKIKYFSCFLLGLLVFGCAELPSVTESPDRLPHLVVLGDRTGGHRPGVFPKMLEYANSLPANAWLSVGDLIEGYSEDPQELKEEWQEIDALFALFDRPLHIAPGNHDISNAVQQAIWLERYGHTYYSIRYGDVLILMLDTEDPPVQLPPEAIEGQNRLVANILAKPQETQAAILTASRANNDQAKKLPGSVAISDSQIAWAKAELEKNRNASWTIVLMHKPAWQYDHKGFLELEEALQDRNYTVIAGHEHYFKQEQRFGRAYITMATCGGIWLKDGPGRMDHLLEIKWRAEQPVLINHRYDGKGFQVEELALD